MYLIPNFATASGPLNTFIDSIKLVFVNPVPKTTPVVVVILNELLLAENNKEPLLFCLIIPHSYFIINKNKYNLYLKSSMYKMFFKYDILLNKEQFPYIRYNKTFTKTIVSPIVDTHILLLHNTYISIYVQNNVNIFEELLNNWLK